MVYSIHFTVLVFSKQISTNDKQNALHVCDVCVMNFLIMNNFYEDVSYINDLGDGMHDYIYIY